MVSKKILQEFQKVLKEEYGQDVTPDQASEIMGDLVRYFDLLAEIHHRPEECLE